MIISNDCIGAFIYKKYNIKFDNPFMYSTIIDEEFYKLVNNFYDINFRNYTYYTLDKAKYDYSYISLVNKIGKQNLYAFLIDNKIEIAFIHYVQSNIYTEKTKIKSEVYSNHIIDILLNNYDNRVNRMSNNVKFIYNEKNIVNYKLIDDLILSNKLTAIFTVRDIENTDKTTVIKKIKPTEKIRELIDRTNLNFIFNI